MDIVVSSDRPAYRILSESGFYGPNDHLYKEGDTIYYDGEPNEDMEPLNSLAEKSLTEFFDKVDAGAREAATKFGRAYRPRVRIQDRMRLATQAMRQLQLEPGGVGIPLMHGVDQGRVASVEQIAKKEVPIMGGQNEPKRRGRPPKVLANANA